MIGFNSLPPHKLKTNNNMDVEIELGKKIIELFTLPKLRQKSKQYGQPYYETSWGSKTAKGIGACVLRIVKETQDDIENS